MSYPAFIIVRDRFTWLMELLDWLDRFGVEEVYLMDNDSQYPPLLEYLASTKHRVLHNTANGGHVVGWNSGWIKRFSEGRRFILSDPDVVPVEECPLDALDLMNDLLDYDPQFRKAGFSLKLDDIPDHYNRKQDVLNHEGQFWNPANYVSEKSVYGRDGNGNKGAYNSPVDTTFALYQDWGVYDHSISPAWRTAPPYEARHMAWYVDTNNLTEEEQFYRSRASAGITTWSR